jgi:serine/threonine-protein phosphatase PP1 catalytic subunit
MKQALPDQVLSPKAVYVLKQIITSRISHEHQRHICLLSSDFIFLINFVSDLLKAEPAVLTLHEGHYMVGDIHGNIDVLIRIFEKAGYPPDSSYLFLGDYIDRGKNSCEVILLLYALKVLYPSKVHLLRGNHEFYAMSESYGFKREYEGRLSREIFEAVIRSFDFLPIAAHIGGNFCVHGGISPQLKSEGDLQKIPKHSQGQAFTGGLVSDLLWSDPSQSVVEFDQNPRGCGVLFG